MIEKVFFRDDHSDKKVISFRVAAFVWTRNDIRDFFTFLGVSMETRDRRKVPNHIMM